MKKGHGVKFILGQGNVCLHQLGMIVHSMLQKSDPKGKPNGVVRRQFPFTQMIGKPSRIKEFPQKAGPVGHGFSHQIWLIQNAPRFTLQLPM